MTQPYVVFTDTNALVAMFCFPKREGKKLMLGQEVFEAVESGVCDLHISDTVAKELRRTVETYFPAFSKAVALQLERFGVMTLPQPSAKLLREAKAICVDPDDAPIAASAILSAKFHDVSYLLSNDIETFHTNDMKRYLATFGLTPITLYGLLRLLEKR